MVARFKISQPSPHVLPSESQVELDDFKLSIRRAFNTQNVIEEHYADEFAHAAWFVLRYRRHSTQCIKKFLGDALFDLLLELDACERDQAALLVDRWCREEADAKAEVRAILKNRGKSELDVETEALQRAMADIAALEQLLVSAGMRRDKAVIMIGVVRELTARQNQPAAKDAVVKHSVVRLERFKGKAG